jgi:threo-3-hydroxy-L-aspartate ammonia-lyase
MTLAISYDDVAAAAQRLAGVAHRTPVLTSRTANELTGAELHFKCENFQRMGAFKFRGAYNALVQFTPEQRKGGVVAFSSGNHAQAIALSARLLGMPATIVMPQDAPAIKIEATRGYGAEVLLYDRYTEDREAISQQLSRERGMTLIPPYDHPHVMAGQGTAALELLQEQSLRRGEIVHIDVPHTIADGAQTQHPGRYTFPVIRALVADVVTVSDDALKRALRFFAARMKIVVEPTGCLGAAAAFERAIEVRGRRVGVILSGGNVDLARYATLLTG